VSRLAEVGTLVPGPAVRYWFQQYALEGRPPCRPIISPIKGDTMNNPTDSENSVTVTPVNGRRYTTQDSPLLNVLRREIRVRHYSIRKIA